MITVVKKLRPRCWRTVAMHDKYENERTSVVEEGSCPMCTAPTKTEHINWRIVENIYPYDAVAERHDMLVTKRHLCSDTELTSEELAELFKLKVTSLNDSYTFIMEALPSNKSIPGHYHLHLIVPKVVT